VNDTYYGTNVEHLKELVDYWMNTFDWRAAETEINTFDNYRVNVYGVPIHLIKEPGKGPAPIPLILSHGWPWGFREWTKIIKPLADPAGLRRRPSRRLRRDRAIAGRLRLLHPINRPDMNFWKMAELWHKLMPEHLGFQQYAAGGSDYGALITGQLGHKYASELYGIWLGHAIHLDLFQGERPWDLTGGFTVPDGAPEEIRDGILAFQDCFVSHVAVHILDPQNLSYGLADSPVGMLAWILRRWTKWSQSKATSKASSRATTCSPTPLGGGSTTRTPAPSGPTSTPTATPGRRPTIASPSSKPPAGITFLGYENPPGVSTENRTQAFLETPGETDWYKTVYLKAHKHGGHFTPWENPQAVIEDIRATFRKVR
jgi:pimeloyl-ACP methyl ester carboxylesterase